MILDTIAVPCPNCGKKILDMPKWIISYYDPLFSHKCGFSGKLTWVNKERAPIETKPAPVKVAPKKPKKPKKVKRKKIK